MTDEFDIVHLNEEEVNEIIDWAVRTGAISFIMKTYPKSKTRADMKEQLESFDKALEAILEAMPITLRGPAVTIAEETRQEVIEEEQMVAEFVEELDGL